MAKLHWQENWGNHNEKILWSALVHVKETNGLGFFKPEVHDGMKWRMVAGLHEYKNFTKRAIKKQQ